MTKRAMISQPMAGKTDEEIAEARDRAHAKLREMGYEFVNTLFTDEWYSDEAMEERGMRISDEERREVAKRLREISYKPGWSLGDWWLRVHGAVVGSEHCLCPQEDVAAIADLIDRPMCHDLVEHKQDPFIPGKRMVDGYFHCSDCGWDGQIWEYIGFGDMLAYEAIHCPKCGAIIERRA